MKMGWSEITVAIMCEHLFDISKKQGLQKRYLKCF